MGRCVAKRDKYRGHVVIRELESPHVTIEKALIRSFHAAISY
jgi:hypothetical protein